MFKSNDGNIQLITGAVNFSPQLNLCIKQQSKNLQMQFHEKYITGQQMMYVLVQIEIDKIRQLKLIGTDLLSITPNQLLKLGATKFMSRRIVQWLQQQSSQFDNLVQQSESEEKEVYKNQPLERQALSVSYCYQKKIPQNNFFAEKPKSQQYLHDPIFPLLKKSSSNEIKDNQVIKNVQNSIENSSLSEQGSQNLDQIVSLKSEGEENQQKSNLIELTSENNTERLQKLIKLDWNVDKKDIRVQLKSQKMQNHYQCSLEKGIQDLNIAQNQSINIAKWQKKKKQESKAFNQRLKARNKQINGKSPKLYNYLSSVNIPDSNEPLSQNQKVGKKIASAQQININNINNKKFNLQIFSEQRQQTKIKSEQITPSSISSQIVQNYNVKFISSQFIPFSPQPNSSKFSTEMSLRIVGPNVDKLVNGFAKVKIGRLTQNQLVLVDETVSRNHAEIISQSEQNGSFKYWLRDIGSKFGTFVECQGVQENIVGKSFLVGDAQIEILSMQLSKQIPQKKPNFDLKFRIDRQKQSILSNRSVVTIGKRVNSDIKIQKNCINARIWVENAREKKFCIEGVEGKLYVKLKQHELWDINSNLDSEGKVQVVFGNCQTVFEVGSLCQICKNKSHLCEC